MEAEASMKKCHHQRALALLGALFLYFFLWPIYCCAARPTWRPPLITDNSSQATASSVNRGGGNVSIPNRAYQDFMTATEKSDNMGTNNEIVDFFNTSNSNCSEIAADNGDTSATKSIDNESTTESSQHQELLITSQTETFSAMSEPMTSSIYELFEVDKRKKKIVPSNQILSRTDRSVHLNSSNSKNNSVSGAKRVKNKTKSSTLERNERSANLSHISGSARKIQLYIKNRFLQLLPDGTVNGTTDDLSDFTILQRTTVNVGQIKIQGVATCLFLCMNSCGTTYSSAEFTDDCIFNESMEQHHYNTYSSTYHSNAKRKLYLGLNRHGQPRKIQLPANRQLGKLSTYTKSLTQTVVHERVEKLIARLFGANHVRHGLKQLCDTGKVLQDILAKGLQKPKCNNLGKANRKKKKKRKCREDEPEGDNCIKATSLSISSQQQNITKTSNSITNINNKKKLNNQHPKKCNANDETMKGPECHPNSPKPNKKKPTKKNNQQKLTGSNTNSKPKPKKKPTKTLAKLTTVPPTTLSESLDLVKDDALTSDELELEDDEYDDANMNVSAAGHSINLVDDNEADDYNN